MMNLSDLSVTKAGINFSVQPAFRFGSQRALSARDCFVSNETLDELAARHHCSSHEPEEIFRRFEQEIAGIAVRLAQAGVGGTPLVVRVENFTTMES